MDGLSKRYWRNIGALSRDEQRTLVNSTVAIIGCGGLGGYVLEQLARLGIGCIMVWDYDVFEEHNLNRQILADSGNIGASKVDAAARRIARVNPEVRILAIDARFDAGLAREKLPEYAVQVVVDALDNIEDRLLLARICRELNLPLVHGAVEGWRGQVATQYPGEMTIETIYSRAGSESNPQPLSTQPLSTLAFTPALVASLQAAEAVKIIIGRGEVLRGRLLAVDLLEMEMEYIDIITAR